MSESDSETKHYIWNRTFLADVLLSTSVNKVKQERR